MSTYQHWCLWPILSRHGATRDIRWQRWYVQTMPGIALSSTLARRLPSYAKLLSIWYECMEYMPVLATLVEISDPWRGDWSLSARLASCHFWSSTMPLKRLAFRTDAPASRIEISLVGRSSWKAFNDWWWGVYIMRSSCVYCMQYTCVRMYTMLGHDNYEMYSNEYCNILYCIRWHYVAM